MLCVGLIHGDLSEFNVLVERDGPVIIDLPQAVSAAGNNDARAMLLRDVNNLALGLGGFAPELLDTLHYGEEMWALFEAGELQPDTALTGRVRLQHARSRRRRRADVHRRCAPGSRDPAAGQGSGGKRRLIPLRGDGRTGAI